MLLSLHGRLKLVSFLLIVGIGVNDTACIGYEGAADAEPQSDPSLALEVASPPLKKGSRGSQVRHAYLYLKKFGYFPNPELQSYPGWTPVLKREPADPEVFDAVMEEAVRLFQGANGLPVDGTLNPETVQLMNTPRCGTPDLYGANARRPGDVSAQWTYSGSKWPSNTIYYSFEGYTPDLPVENTRRAILDALQRWEAVTTFNFVEGFGWGAPQIRINFLSFDGPGRVLAHTTIPPEGRVIFDEAETWRDNLSGGAVVDLPSIALHELGHALGLAHSADSRSVMQPTYSGARRNLSQDDIHGIISIYGVRAVASWSGAGPIPGKYCTQIHESSDRHTWNDNYFCMDSYQGVQWGGAGPIPGMRCTQVREPSDPDNWHDNYLCVPMGSPFYFSWSSAGPILGKRCVQWHESADPHDWYDNFLCY